MGSIFAVPYLKQTLEQLRPYNALPPSLAFAIGLTASGEIGDVRMVATGIAVIFLAHAFATLQNDIEDREIDWSNRRKSILLSGVLSVQMAARLNLWFLLLAFLIALTARHYDIHLAFALVFVLLAWIYNRPPLLLSRRPVWSITLLGLFFGAVPMAYGLSLAGGTVPASLLLLIPAWFLLRFSVSILKDYKDVAGDVRHHKRTFLITYGPAAVRTTSLVCAVLGYALLSYVLSRTVAFSLLSGVFLVTITGLIGYALWLRRTLRPDLSYKKANRRFHDILALTNILDAGILLWLISS